MAEISLDALGIKYGTDKASIHHDYLNFYEQFLLAKRHEPLKVLEIGVLGGSSLRTWEEFFPNATIIGADITPTAKQHEKGRALVEILDQSNIEQLTRMAMKHGPFDLVIEDGSHMCEHQITSLKTIFPFVKDNGIYIVEDLQTNYGSMLKKYMGVSSITCVEYLKKWLDIRVGDDLIDVAAIEDPFLRTYGRSIEFITFYRRACLIKKRLLIEKPKVTDAPLVPSVSPALEVAIKGHLSHLGDLAGTNYINPYHDRNEFQGLALTSSESILEYKVRLADGQWTDWAKEGTFLGSRGKSALLTGLAVRINRNAASDYSVTATCRFKDEVGLVQRRNGEECLPLSKPNAPLCAVQVEVKKA